MVISFVDRSPNILSDKQHSSILAAGTSYAAALLIIVFASGLAVRFSYISTSIILACAGSIVIAFLVLNDRLILTSRRLQRTGLMSRVAGMFTGASQRLRLTHIEQIETTAFQRFRRGGNVAYAYHTTVRGRNARFEIHSGRLGYAEFITGLLSRVPEDVLDNRSIELRDYFAARKEVRLRARESEIPGGDVLEESFRRARSPRTRAPDKPRGSDPEKAESLRRLGNELRIAGFLLQSLEAFRRAVLMQPANGWLLFDYGRCLLSCAVTEKDKKLERRAFAMMRLAEQRAGGDAKLLAQLGESYFHAGNWDRSLVVFRKASDTVGDTFRSVRGLAEIALREGKFAHVIHNFSIANSLTTARSLKRWTNSEIEYFTKLNDDEQYMELEISRLNLIDTLSKVSASTFRIAAVGVAVVVAGHLLDDHLTSDVGWAIAAIALIIWAVSLVMKEILSARIPIDIYADEE